jgi:hypothetical protein
MDLLPNRVMDLQDLVATLSSLHLRKGTFSRVHRPREAILKEVTLRGAIPRVVTLKGKSLHQCLQQRQ